MPTYSSGKNKVTHKSPYDPEEKRFYSFSYRPDDWTATTEVVKGKNVFVPTTSNGFMQECISGGITGGTEPSWSTTENGETTDGTATFRAKPLYSLLNAGDVITTSTFEIKSLSDAWVTATVLAVGDSIIPTTPNGYRFVVTVAGTTDSSEPTWDATLDALTTDNDITYIAVFIGTFDNDSIVNSRTARCRLTAVPDGVTSIELENSIVVTRANSDVEEFNRTMIIKIKQL